MNFPSGAVVCDVGVRCGYAVWAMDRAAVGLDAVMLVVPTFLFLRVLAFNICTRV